jgi:hypothetical protein
MLRHVRDDGSFPRKQPCPASVGRGVVCLSGDAQSVSPSRMLQARSGKIISVARRLGECAKAVARCATRSILRSGAGIHHRGRRVGYPFRRPRLAPREIKLPPSALGEGLPGANAGRRHAGAPVRLRGLVSAWRLVRPRHRGQSGREIPPIRIAFRLRLLARKPAICP